MPKYTIEHPDGRVIEMEGATPPSEQDIDQAFAGIAANTEKFPEKQGMVSAMGNAFARDAVTGIGHAAAGLAFTPGTMTEGATLHPEGTPEQMAAQERYLKGALERGINPSVLLDRVRRDPAYKWGKDVAEAAPETFPVDARREENVLVKGAGMAGGFLPLIASGRLAPGVIGVQSAGAHLTQDFERAKEAGMDDDAAAALAMDTATKSGLVQAGVFTVLPGPLKAAASKWILGKFGETALANFISGRVALGAEGVVLGGVSTAGENVASGQPIGQHVLEGAGAMGAMNLLLPPYGVRRPAARLADPAVETPPMEPTAELPAPAEPPPPIVPPVVETPVPSAGPGEEPPRKRGTRLEQEREKEDARRQREAEKERPGKRPAAEVPTPEPEPESPPAQRVVGPVNLPAPPTPQQPQQRDDKPPIVIPQTLEEATAQIEQERLRNKQDVADYEAEKAGRSKLPTTEPAAPAAEARYTVEPAPQGVGAVVRDNSTGKLVIAAASSERAVEEAAKLNAVDNPPPQPTVTEETPNERTVRQPEPSASGVDVREPAGPGPAPEPVEPAPPAPRSEEPAGPAPGGPTERAAEPAGGRSVPGGDGGDPGAGGRTGNERPAAEPAPLPGTAADLPKVGNLTPGEANVNHVLPAGEDWIPSGDKAKVRANLDAVALLKQLEAENRNPTPDEKAVLARYTGWGGLKEIFDSGKAAYRERPPYNSDQKREFDNWERQWGKLYDETKSTLTPEEHAAAAKSILNAHYTSREIINSVWKAVERLGFKGGKALEPAGGIGHFLGLTPEGLRGATKWTGVELDNLSGRILAKLYPEARVHQMGFQETRIAPNSQDLVISNVPFAAGGPVDKRYPAGLSLHNYFFARALDLVKPGGIVAAITSDSTMDGTGASRKAREYFAEKADLVGAIRLPNTAFKKNAGTEVTTDILFFRKRDGQRDVASNPFTRTVPAESYKGEPIEINEYFAAHPEMMLGRMSKEDTMYGRGEQQALLPTPGADLSRQLEEAIAKLPENVFGRGEAMPTGAEPVLAEKGAKVGALMFKGEVPQLPQPDGTVERPDWAGDAKKVKQAQAYVAIRDATKQHIARMLSTEATEAEIAQGQAGLNKLYDAYYKKYGAINERRSAFLDDDVDFPLALALEDAVTTLVEQGGKAKRVTEYTKGKMFTERTIFPRVPPERVDSVTDGLQVSQNFAGKVDPDYIAKLTGTSVDQVKAELEASGAAFENPATGQFENRATFLSGFVRDKLKAAIAAAEADPRFQKHVAELQKVQPPPVAIEGIGVKLGSVWVPEKVVEQFIQRTLDVDARVSFTPQTGTWHVIPRSGQFGERNRSVWGVHDWKGTDLVQQSLNLKSAVVTRMEGVGKDAKEVRDAAKSVEAQERQAKLQEEFRKFVLSTPETARELEQIYNDRYNGVAAPKFEAPTWAHYPGASNVKTLRPHQKAVVTRMLQNSTLLAHAVGTGKTLAMTTAAMEMRRLGLARKPMIVVQNATLEQFAAAFKSQYPTARILVPNARQRDATNRNKTMSRIATGVWDAVIIPQSFVNMLPDSPVRERSFIADRLRELEDARIEAAHSEGKRSPKAADLQRAIDRLNERLKSLADRKKDNVLTFEELGVDALFVDEAHAYKKLEFGTRMDNIKGLDKGASQRGWSMWMKTQWIHEKNQGRNVIFATGTPVSNTIAEAWNMMRYVRPDVLEKYGIETFDAFASTFGDTVTQLEMTAGGTWKPVTRFARYTNGPELIAAWRTVADVVTPEEINLPGLPSLKTGRPITHTIKQSPQLANYVQFLRGELARFDKMTGKEKKENSHIPLVTFGLAKKASLDMRMVNPDLADQPDSKLNVAADEIARLYNDSTSVKGAQMVFSDAFQDNPDAPRFNLYTEIKKKLIARGVPEEQIAIITADIKDARREALFKKVNDGDLRIVIGSTERMGVGVNAQEHLIGLHHLDAPPRPMDLEQRNGRILRQGNQNPEVEVHTYGVENTLDAAMFQKLATKQKFINQILRGDLQGRNFEDAANEQGLTFEEQMAAFSGDKRAMEKVALENQVRQLEALRAGHFEQVRKARETIANLQERIIPYQTKQLAEAQRRAQEFDKAFAGNDLVLDVGGRRIEGRKEVSAAMDTLFKAGIEETLKSAKDKNVFGDARHPLGSITLNGRQIELKGFAPADAKGIQDPEKASVEWRFVDGDMGSTSKSGSGFLLSLASRVEAIAGEPDRAARSLANEQRNLRELSGLVQGTFEREGELKQVRDRLDTLTKELEAEGKAQMQAAAEASASGGEVEHDMASGYRPGPGAPPRPPRPPKRSRPAPPSGHPDPGPIEPLLQDLRRVQAISAPQTISEPARFAGNLLRQLNAAMAAELTRADHALKPYRDSFDRSPLPRKWKYDPTVPLPRNLAFIDAYEGGTTAALPAKEQALAAELKRQNDAWIDRIHATDPAALNTFYENYFPHLWDNPQRAKSVLSSLLAKSPLEGSKSFLKQRTHQYFRDGLAAGLKPVHDNPIDLWLLKKREVERFILGREFQQEMKAAGLLKFKYYGQAMPEGWSTNKDKAFEAWAPPVVTVKEAFDAGQREAMLDGLAKMGIPHERLVKLGGQRWGVERDMPGVPGTEKIQTKFGGPDFVMFHEFGHALDNRYKDFRQIFEAFPMDAPINQELRDLAELRFEGMAMTPHQRRYVRSWPEKMAVIAQAYMHAPERMQQVAPTVKAAFANFLATHPELDWVNKVKPSLLLGEGEAQMKLSGFVRLGDWIMPEGATRVVDNYLSSGLNPHLWYRSLRETSNFLNGVQLGLSAFHLGFTSLDAAVSRLAIGIEDAVRGNLAGAVKAIVSVPASPFTNIRQGAKLRAAVLDPLSATPELRELAKMVERAGGRVGQDAFWQTQFTRRMVRGLHELSLPGAAKAVLNAPFAILEQTMRPIMEYVVPRQKLGVFADMAKREMLRLGPTADPAQVREAMRKAWDSVDNRMGQVVYDNLFYNRMLKDVALLSFRAYGWQLGKYREGLGAVYDTATAAGKILRGRPGEAEFTHRMAYAIALPLAVGILGGTLHYLMTGQAPDDARDYFMPRTGETDKNGNAVRLHLPSYVKDVIAYTKHPVTAFGHSLNPLFASIADLLQNRDFYDVRIRNPEDPIWQQGSDVAKYAASQFVPFSVSNQQKLRQDDAPTWKQVAPFFGITPVPSRITMSPAQELAAEIMADAMPRGARAPQEMERSKMIKSVVKLVKSGDRAAAVDQLRAGLDAGLLNENTAVTLIDRLKYTPFQFQVHHLNAEGAMRVWRISTPEERATIQTIVRLKIAGNKTMSED